MRPSEFLFTKFKLSTIFRSSLTQLRSSLTCLAKIILPLKNGKLSHLKKELQTRRKKIHPVYTFAKFFHEELQIDHFVPDVNKAPPDFPGSYQFHAFPPSLKSARPPPSLPRPRPIARSIAGHRINKLHSIPSEYRPSQRSRPPFLAWLAGKSAMEGAVDGRYVIHAARLDLRAT